MALCSYECSYHLTARCLTRLRHSFVLRVVLHASALRSAGTEARARGTLSAAYGWEQRSASNASRAFATALCCGWCCMLARYARRVQRLERVAHCLLRMVGSSSQSASNASRAFTTALCCRWCCMLARYARRVQRLEYVAHCVLRMVGSSAQSASNASRAFTTTLCCGCGCMLARYARRNKGQYHANPITPLKSDTTARPKPSYGERGEVTGDPRRAFGTPYTRARGQKPPDMLYTLARHA